MNNSGHSPITSTSSNSEVDRPQRWIGHIRGSRVGTLFVESSKAGEALVVIGFSGAGDVRLKAKTDESNTANLVLADSDEVFGEAIAESVTGQNIEGRYNFINGASGIFDLSLVTHDSKVSVDGSASASASRFWTQEKTLGAVTLYRDDLIRLISQMRELVDKPCSVIVRAVEGENVVTEDTSTYLARTGYRSVIRIMTLSAEEKTSAPIKRIAMVRLESDSNAVMVSSGEQIWTTAAAIQLASFSSQFTSGVTSVLKRHGLNINSFIIVAIFLWMPDRPLIERLIVFALGVLLITAITKSHGLFPFNRVYMDPSKEKRPFAKELPGAIMTTVAAILLSLLAKTPEIFAWFSNLAQGLVSRL